jgi:hypothetical protein
MADSARSARLRSRITLVLAVLILIPSIFGFGTKFIEFVKLYRGDVEGAFAIAPIVNYLLASTGFFLALLWAIANGMLHDIERPKYTMLENEELLDRGKPTR